MQLHDDISRGFDNCPGIGLTMCGTWADFLANRSIPNTRPRRTETAATLMSCGFLTAMRRQQGRRAILVLTSRVLTVVLGVAWTTGCTGVPRSDGWLRAHFLRNRGDFERLVAMANEDYAKTKVIRIDDAFTRLADDSRWPRPANTWGITPQRWDEYRAMFRRLKLPAGLNRNREGHAQILLMMHAVGLNSEGTQYGYLWSRVPPVRIDDRTQFFAAKRLEGDWYLYTWSDR